MSSVVRVLTRAEVMLVLTWLAVVSVVSKVWALAG